MSREEFILGAAIFGAGAAFGLLLALMVAERWILEFGHAAEDFPRSSERGPVEGTAINEPRVCGRPVCRSWPRGRSREVPRG